MSAQNVAAVERFQAILDTEDVVASLSDQGQAMALGAALEAEAGPDFEVAMVGPQYDSGEFRGKGPVGFFEVWSEWMSAFESYRIELGEVVDAGDDTVVSFVTQRGTTRTGGVEIEAPGAALWTVRDGRVVAVEFHLEPDEALRRAGLEPQSGQE